MREAQCGKKFRFFGNVASICFTIFGLISCGNRDKEKKPDPPKQTSEKIEFHLTDNKLTIPGMPIVKIVANAGTGILSILVEKLSLETFPNGSPTYTLDHPRFIYRLNPGGEPQLITLPMKSSFLTDVTDGPEANQLLVSVVDKDDDQSIRLKHKILLIQINEKNEVTILDEVTISALFPDLDKARILSFLQYQLDTVDVGRIFSKNGQVFLVGRNGFGVPFSFVTSIAAGQFTRGEVAPIGPKLQATRVGMTGGTYDVKQQLSLPSKVHATWETERPIVALQLEGGGSELVSWKEFYPDIEFPQAPDEAWARYVVFITFDQALHPSKAQMQILGSANAELHGISVFKETGIAFGVDRRQDLSFSDPIFVTMDGVRIHETLMDKASDARALFVNGDRLMLAGSTDWSQNPNGLSISGGVGYIANFDPNSKKISDFKILEDFQKPRSEVRQIFRLGKQLCFAGMVSGPDTHSADGDIKRLTGDGVISCAK